MRKKHKTSSFEPGKGGPRKASSYDKALTPGMLSRGSEMLGPNRRARKSLVVRRGKNRSARLGPRLRPAQVLHGWRGQCLRVYL